MPVFHRDSDLPAPRRGRHGGRAAAPPQPLGDRNGTVIIELLAARLPRPQRPPSLPVPGASVTASQSDEIGSSSDVSKASGTDSHGDFQVCPRSSFIEFNLSRPPTRTASAVAVAARVTAGFRAEQVARSRQCSEAVGGGRGGGPAAAAESRVPGPQPEWPDSGSNA